MEALSRSRRRARITAPPTGWQDIDVVDTLTDARWAVGPFGRLAVWPVSHIPSMCPFPASPGSFSSSRGKLSDMGVYVCAGGTYGRMDVWTYGLYVLCKCTVCIVHVYCTVHMYLLYSTHTYALSTVHGNCTHTYSSEGPISSSELDTCTTRVAYQHAVLFIHHRPGPRSHHGHLPSSFFPLVPSSYCTVQYILYTHTVHTVHTVHILTYPRILPSIRCPGCAQAWLAWPGLASTGTSNRAPGQPSPYSSTVCNMACTGRPPGPALCLTWSVFVFIGVLLFSFAWEEENGCVFGLEAVAWHGMAWQGGFPDDRDRMYVETVVLASSDLHSLDSTLRITSLPRWMNSVSPVLPPLQADLLVLSCCCTVLRIVCTPPSTTDLPIVTSRPSYCTLPLVYLYPIFREPA